VGQSLEVVYFSLLPDGLRLSGARGWLLRVSLTEGLRNTEEPANE
jgi:hypothetical protein